MVQKGANETQDVQYEVPVEQQRVAKIEYIKKKIAFVFNCLWGAGALYTLISMLWGIINGNESFGGLAFVAVCLFIFYMVSKVAVLFVTMKVLGAWYLTKDIAKY